MDSADQDKWVEVSEAIRNGLEKKLSHMTEMSASEMLELTNAFISCQTLEIRAKTYDRKLEKEKSLFQE